MNKIIIVIPTYNPTSLLIDTINDLDSIESIFNLQKIILNDGSDDSIPFLEDLKKRSNITIINHSTNLGKGAAIKTAIRYIQNSFPYAEAVITVDSDSQHKATDVLSILECLKFDTKSVHIGVRSLSKEITPLRSYFGNQLTRQLFYFLYKFDLNDTQSGLRAYPSRAFEILLSLKSNRYEFEMEAIVKLLKNKFLFNQIAIKTIYIDKNSTSHFKPLKDSIKIINVLIKNFFNK